MKVFLFIISYTACLLSPPCLKAGVYCGEVEKYFFDSPDMDKKYEATMLKFGQKQKIEYSLLEGNERPVATIDRFQIIPSSYAQGEIGFKELLSLTGKHVCISGDPLESHTAHHVPPVILVNPKLMDCRQVDKRSSIGCDFP